MPTPKEIAAENDRLAKENKELKEQLAAAQKKADELEKSKPASKSRMQATAALHMLEQGPVGMDALAKLNQKYPSDPIYYVRTLLKQDVKLVRRSGQPSLYMLPKDFLAYTLELEKSKKVQEAVKQEVKEEIPTPQASPAPQQAAHV